MVVQFSSDDASNFIIIAYNIHSWFQDAQLSQRDRAAGCVI